MASEIVTLAALVLTSTVKVDDYLQTHRLLSPSLHEDGPVDLKLSDPIEATRIAALEASVRLGDLLCGPVKLVRPTVRLHILVVHEFPALAGQNLSTGQCGQS